MKTSLFALAALVLPLAAQAYDISPYGTVTCERGSCDIVVPLKQTLSKAACEEAYKHAYELLNESNHLILEAVECSVDQGVRQLNGREQLYTKGYSGHLTFR